MMMSSSEHFWFINHDFSARAPNYLAYVIVAVQNMKIHVFRKVPSCFSIFSERVCDFCKVPLQDFLKNHGFEAGFEQLTESIQ
jgi:hypothetical protein